MDKPENPPAFPTDGRIQHGTPYDGMSLRDYFAGQVLVGAMTQATNIGSLTKDDRAALFREMAGIIYEVADAMLAERLK